MIARSIKQGFINLGLAAFLALALILSAFSSASAQAESNTPRADQAQAAERQTNQATAGEQPLANVAAAEAQQPALYEFLATAYCLRGITFSGVRVRSGIVAADPKVLPIGSIIRVKAGPYSGIYTVLDTGAKIKGRRLDLWLPTYQKAIEFGVRKVKVEIIRYGWDPTETEISSL